METENLNTENTSVEESVAERLAAALCQIKSGLPGLELRENEPMDGHCSFKAGGSVFAYAAPQDVFSLSKVCSILKDHRLMPFVLGNGTNVVFPDEGCCELFVLSTSKLQNMYMLPDGSIYAEAGVPLSRLAAFARDNSLAGLEFASGIPGTVGGACIMNAGAYGGEIKDVVDSVVCYYLPEQMLYEVKNDNCAFGYRTSWFKTNPGCLVMSAVFRLEAGDKDEISARMKELNERRRDKQPLDYPSAGSAFKRPEGHFAAKLIEDAGLKGASVGGAMVSEKHAGFIINTGSATSSDIYNLMMKVRNEVYRSTGIELEPEIILLPPDYKLEDHSPPVHKNFSGPPSVGGIG